MEGDLRRDRAAEETAETSGITGANSRGMGGEEHEEITSAGLPVTESRSMEWTDEKHSLYLNYMETSFVRKMYNHEYCSTGSLSWKSKRKNLLDPISWQKLNSNNVTSDHFEMLQSGCWRMHNFEKAQPKSHIADESSISVNPWVERFKVGKQSKHQAISYNVQVNGATCSKAADRGFHSTSSRNSSPCNASNIQEVSDQNFVNEENEGGQSSSAGRTKKAKTVGSDISENDQVVPVGKIIS